MVFLPSFSLETWILLLVLTCTFFVYGSWTHGVFKKLGIPGPRPLVYWGTVGRNSEVYYLDDEGNARKYGKVWGAYEFRKPLLFVMDPAMLQVILVKECFTLFTNRRNLRLNGDLFFPTDDDWRRTRRLLSPSFATGRIKQMFSVMKRYSRKLTARLGAAAEAGDVVQVKDVFGPYALDVIMSCVLGVDADLIDNPSSPALAHGEKLFRFPALLFIFQACFPVFLPLLELLGVSLFPSSTVRFFTTMVEKIRAEHDGSSPQEPGTILRHMVDSQATHNGFTDHEITSQATLFLSAGFHTSATALGFLAYELARNPAVAARLQQEIDATFPEKGPVQYEALMQMEYLDTVVSECLRLHPPAARLDREAKETVKIDGVTIPKGMVVTVPVYALHRDPELWAEPEEFRPDRFSAENKASVRPYTYLPFGAGPRNCVGMRLALVMVKLGLVEVLQNFSFVVCEETEIPLTMDPQGILAPLRPIKLKLAPRSENVDGRD